jgi:hypothetical protein
MRGPGKFAGGKLAHKPGQWHGHHWHNNNWGRGGYGHGWYGHRGWWGNWGWGLGLWPWFTPGLFWPAWGYYSWRPGFGWGWWDTMYYESPYIVIEGRQVLDRPWWHIANNTTDTITVTNANGSDEVDIPSGQKAQLMQYGTESFTVTFPNGYQANITTSDKNVGISVDQAGNVMAE